LAYLSALSGHLLGKHHHLPTPAHHGVDRSLPLAVALACLLLYLYTMPRTVALEDDGFFILASWFNGIAHPPGYPLFTLIAHAFSQIPWGSVAMRVHAVSALFGAIACGTLWYIARELGLGRLLATLTALLLGFSSSFWSQAIIAEVYTLNALLFFLSLWLTLRLRHCGETTRCRRLVILLGLVFGLATANHWPLTFLAAPGLLLILAPQLPRLWRYLPHGVLALLVGMSPYLWLYLRSQADPFISFYGPLHNLRELFSFVSREVYSGFDNTSTAAWSDRADFSLYLLRELARQFSPAALPFMLFGLVRQFRHLPLGVALAFLWIFFSNGFLLVGLQHLDYNYITRTLFHVYPLVSYGIAALWTALGLRAALDLLSPRLPDGARTTLLRYALALLLPAGALITNAPDNMRQGYHWSELYARQIFSMVEPGAAIFTSADIDTGVLGYFRYVEGWRPDTEVFSSNGIIFSNRLGDRPVEEFDEKMRLLSTFITANERPVYFTIGATLPGVGFSHRWLLVEVRRDLPTGAMAYSPVEPLLPFLNELIRQEGESDPWTRYHCQLLLREIVAPLSYWVHAVDNADQAQFWSQILHQVTGATAIAELDEIRQEIVHYPVSGQEPQLISRLERWLVRVDPTTTKEDQAYAEYLLGRLHGEIGATREAQYHYDRSISLWPNPGNPAAHAGDQAKLRPSTAPGMDGGQVHTHQ